MATAALTKGTPPLAAAMNMAVWMCILRAGSRSSGGNVSWTIQRYAATATTKTETPTKLESKKDKTNPILDFAVEGAFDQGSNVHTKGFPKSSKELTR